MRSTGLRTIIAIATVGSLTSCGGSASGTSSASAPPSVQQPQPSTGTAPTASTSPTSAAQAPAFAGTTEVVDIPGYKWRVDYSVTVLGSHKDVSNDLPGRASAVLDLQQSMTKTFDDPGRNNPYGSTPGVWLGALYPINGPVCGQANNGDPGEVDVTAGVAPGKYCFWQYHPEQSQSMESISNIPEGDEPGVEQAFAHPSAYAVVSVTDSPNGNSGCPLRMAGSPTGDRPFYIVASSVSGLTCSPPA